MFDPADIQDTPRPIFRSASEPERVIMGQAPVAGRTPPHSVDAEESLLACCLIDGRASFEAAAAGGILPESFYEPSHRLMWEVLEEIHRLGQPMDEAVLAEELRKRGLLDGLGGYARLNQITNRIPTTAHRVYFIEQVRDSQLLRQVITASTRAIEGAYQYQGERTSFLSHVVEDFNRIVKNGAASTEPKPMQLASFVWPENDQKVLIGTKRRWLSRGGSLLIVGHSGTGKSVLSYQAAACWSVGRNLLGIDCVKPLRVLIVQAEDDDGDVGEIRESIVQGLKFTPEELVLFGQNCLVIHDAINSGPGFLTSLGRYIDKAAPDLVILNPLLAYVGGDLSKQEVIASFIRNGLYRLNAQRGNPMAFVFIHHTPKPPSGEKSKAERGEYEHQYLSFGSSDLVNAVRAVAILEPRKGEGTEHLFYLRLAKRGSRAGVKQVVSNGTGTHEEFVDKISIRHSTGKVEINGTKHPMILWELADSSLPPGERKLPPAPGPEPAPRVSKADEGVANKILEYFPLDPAKARNLSEIIRQAAEQRAFNKLTCARAFALLEDSGRIRKNADGLWYQVPAAVAKPPTTSREDEDPEPLF